MKNPFTFNLPVDEEMFFGRQNELDFVVDQITATPGDSVALIAGRRMGKTSFLEALLRKLSKNENEELLIIPIYIDLSGELLSTVVEFYELIAGEMITEVGKTFPEVAARQDAEITDSPAKQVSNLLQFLEKELIPRGKRFRCILLLDEMEHIIEKDWAPSLFSTLRYLLIHKSTRGLIKLVASGSHQFLLQVQEKGSPLRNILKYQYLYSLSYEESVQLIRSPLPFEFLPENIQAIIAETGGHPCLIQYIMHNLWNDIIGEKEITRQSIYNVSRSYGEDRTDFLDWTRVLGKKSIAIYRHLVKTAEKQTSEAISKALAESHQEIMINLNGMRYHGMIEHSDDGTYSLSGTMYCTWFAKNHQNTGDARPEQKINIFISYAHEDEAYCRKLKKHLANLERQNKIHAWFDREIIAGQHWADEINENLERSKIIIFLISSDFMASDYCNEIEASRALQMHANKEAVVIPVIVRSAHWLGSSFSHLQALPKHAIPITKWGDEDEAYLDVVLGIEKVINHFYNG